MKTKFAALSVLVVSLSLPISAHRLDEYLQATLLSVENGSVHASMRLVPGVAVASTILGAIDTNGDGVISTPERDAYAQRVLNDLSLRFDGTRLNLRLLSVQVPAIGEMKEGLGEITIDFTADLPSRNANHTLVLENHHQPGISVYLVNSLVPRDPAIRLLAQNRNPNQSFYELRYVESGSPLAPAVTTRWSRIRAPFAALVGLGNMFRLGMRHIAEGTDHLLFLLTLLLPAPLFAFGPRWAGAAGVRRSLSQILKVVTAFTLGHSITLALAGFGVVLVPSRPVEVLIAISILVSAVHALRPLFPGREAFIAASFGLVHGLAFAATLSQLGLDHWARLANIFAFNVGIETMQLIVVLCALPSLVLLSSTPAYSYIRVGGALFAGVASIGWIAERLFNVQSSFDPIIDALAHRAVWIAAVLLVITLFYRSLRARTGRNTGIEESLPRPSLHQSA